MNILYILGKSYTAKKLRAIELGISGLKEEYRTPPQENLEEADLKRCQKYASYLARIERRASSRGLANYIIEGKANELSRTVQTFTVGFTNGRQSVVDRLQDIFQGKKTRGI